MTCGEIETLCGDDTPLYLVGGAGEVDCCFNIDRLVSISLADLVGLVIEGIYNHNLKNKTKEFQRYFTSFDLNP
jgi:hypothetical protein